MQAILSIAGSDSSGGAGIQADIKTIAAHGLFAETAITALTAQNTMGVFGVQDVTPDFVQAQIDAVFEDISPVAVKVGMVSSPEIARAIAQALERNKARNVVLDPVMVATSGARLISEDAAQALVEQLFPLASVITPNLPEAEALVGHAVAGEQAAERAAEELTRLTPGAVLVKGGHGEGGAADDLLRLANGRVVWLRGRRIDTNNTHGTGCTLSSAIACELAVGLEVEEAVRRAKTYVTGALADGLDLGHGSGPLNHLYRLL